MVGKTRCRGGFGQPHNGITKAAGVNGKFIQNNRQLILSTMGLGPSNGPV